MLALGALLAALLEKGAALVASSANALTNALVHKILLVLSCGPGEHDLLVVLLIAVVGNDRRILLVAFKQCGSPRTALLALLVIELGRVASTLGAADVLTVRALLPSGKLGVTLVTSAANAHADSLIDTKDSVILRSHMHFTPIANVKLQAKLLTQVLGALLKKLTL